MTPVASLASATRYARIGGAALPTLDQSAATGLADGLAVGLAGRLADGLADGLAGRLADGLADGGDVWATAAVGATEAGGGALWAGTDGAAG